MICGSPGWKTNITLSHISISLLHAVFLWTFVKGRAHTSSVEASGFYAVCMSPTHNESLEIQSFEHCDEIEICGGIIFIFYVGLPTYITPSLINELVSA